jgi:hypothetical protein
LALPVVESSTQNIATQSTIETVVVNDVDPILIDDSESSIIIYNGLINL